MESRTVRMVLMRMTARSSLTPATSTTSIAATAGTVSTDLRYSNSSVQLLTLFLSSVMVMRTVLQGTMKSTAKKVEMVYEISKVYSPIF